MRTLIFTGSNCVQPGQLVFWLPDAIMEQLSHESTLDLVINRFRFNCTFSLSTNKNIHCYSSYVGGGRSEEPPPSLMDVGNYMDGLAQSLYSYILWQLQRHKVLWIKTISSSLCVIMHNDLFQSAVKAKLYLSGHLLSWLPWHHALGDQKMIEIVYISSKEIILEGSRQLYHPPHLLFRVSY